MTLKQAAAAALVALCDGDQAKVNDILNTAARIHDYDSLSSKRRQGRLWTLGWAVCGTDWTRREAL